MRSQEREGCRSRGEASRKQAAVIFKRVSWMGQGGVGHGKRRLWTKAGRQEKADSSSVAGAKWKVRGQEARRDEEGNGGDVTVE